MQGAWIRSLVGELRSHMLCGAAKIKEKNKIKKEDKKKKKGDSDAEDLSGA